MDSATQYFELWAQLIESNPQLCSRFHGRFLFRVTDSTVPAWLLECGSKTALLPYQGGEVEVEITTSESDFLRILRRELNPQLAFLEKRIRLKGKTKYVLRFNLLLETLIELLEPKSTSSGLASTGPEL